MKNQDRSSAIAKSWTDAQVSAARTTRHAVVASGKLYPSTKAAFVALGLPLSNHIAFRMALKADGVAVFPLGNRRRITFRIAQEG